MITLDLNSKMLDIEGKETNTTIAKLLSRLLADDGDKTIDSLKFGPWMLQLYSEGSIMLDESDYKKLIKKIERLDGITGLGRYRILSECDKQKKISEESTEDKK